MSVDYAETNLPHREALLCLLRDQRWHPHWELARVAGVRYSARVLELRRLGHDIETRDVQSGQGREYRLVGRCAPQTKRVKVFLEERDAINLLNELPYGAAWSALLGAYESFKANRDRL